ncbi:alpha-(1,4)-fucosyltransferase-like [Prosopis cineraria]|uniref:alpha-(1,4)-fucosyltransferase-like n=1 Tax=Prosopis cineraria TaxID=364024 RepID=UPI00240F5D4C|nr:alpha-(1,4)-fucosyltransferase-like [Prosopis cineraria]
MRACLEMVERKRAVMIRCCSPSYNKLMSLVTVVCFVALILLISAGTIEFPSSSYFYSLPSFTTTIINYNASMSDHHHEGFTDLLGAFKEWDSQVGCERYKKKLLLQNYTAVNSSLREEIHGGGASDSDEECEGLKMKHVSVLVKGPTWIPDSLDNLYTCRCGLSCLWTKSSVLADNPDALLFEKTKPPRRRKVGEPIRVYMDLEPERKRTGREDIFISYHADDDIQTTYAGAFFHNNRNYHVSSHKNSGPLVYWSSSHCVSKRNKVAQGLLSMLPHHSFGKCLNNVNGRNKVLSFYPHCTQSSSPRWWDHLHCAMSHYKFVLAIENTWTNSYVTEKLFYALDSAAIPIYFGAPNIDDFVPPHSVIDGSKFTTLQDLALYVKALANDSVAYAEYHAWRRCGLLGNYAMTRGLSLDSLPCRLCELISRKGGRNADSN